MNIFIQYKKLFLSLGFVVLILLLGFIIYTLFFKPLAPAPVITEEPEKATTTAGLPGAQTGQGQITTGTEGSLPGDTGSISEETAAARRAAGNDLLYKPTEMTKAPALGATLGVNGSDVQYYDASAGKFYRVDRNGEVTSLSDKVFHAVEKITWSTDKNKAVLEYPDGANVVYNFETQKQVTLPAHWKDFSFEPSGDKIVMKSMGLDEQNRWLTIGNDDGTQFKAIEALGDKDATVYPSWSPNKQIVAMFTEGIDFDRQAVYFVGLNHENFKSTVIEGRGFQPKWSPEGDKLLYSVYSSNTDLKPNLWIVDAQGEAIGNNRRNLNLATWADKCVFSNSLDLYCAVPESLEEGSGLMPELALNSKDNLYKINLATGAKKLIAVPEGSFSINNLIVSDNQNYIYFTDSATQKLHKIKL